MINSTIKYKREPLVNDSNNFKRDIVNDKYKFLLNLKFFSWDIKIGGIINKNSKLNKISN
jgi:hypothetical protein